MVHTNPIWHDGVGRLAAEAASAMDEGSIPGSGDGGDNGGSTYSPVNTEAYAALFAFLALVDPDASARAEWAQRSHTLLFHVLDRVDACLRSTPPVATGPYCSIAFSVSDRSRWQGAAFPLAVDWLGAATLPSGQPALSAADKAEIRRVFIWWSYLNREAYPNPYNNPPQDSLPVGTTGEPLLRLEDPRHYRLRFSGNNYFAGHMRQLGLMALALDRAADVVDPLAPATYLKLDANGDLAEYPFDDANGRLTGFLDGALDAWLYMQDYLLRTDGRGGLPIEGMEYEATSLGIPSQFQLALDTAGYADADGLLAHGDRIAALDTNPFYRAIVPGYLNSLSPVPADNPDRGQVYWPAWYGDGEAYYQTDSMNILGPLALHAERIGDTRTLDTVRWIERHVPPGGSDELSSRARNTEDILKSLLYFLVFDPNAASSGENAPDPRPGYPLSFWSDGLGRLLSRTAWDASASWFDFKLGWNSVDHQHGDALMIELYRDGEWLTKGALGYGLEGGATDYENSIGVENTLWPGEDPDGALARRLRRGAQMPQGRTSADPEILARSEHPLYSYVSGDATNLYNAWYDEFDPTPIGQRASDVQHVSRSAIWLKGDLVVAYDRIRTLTANRFKRLWFNLPDRLPALPAIAGPVATSTTPNGQHLFVTSVLPAAKTLAIVTEDPEISLARGNLWSLGDEDPILQRRPYVDPDTGTPVPDTFENYATRLRIDATGGPRNTRFLTVLQGGGADSVAAPASVLSSVVAAGCSAPAGTFEGVAIDAYAVMFRRDAEGPYDCLEYITPAAATRHYVTGLTPWRRYTFTATSEGASRRIHIAGGSGTARADEGGVLRFDLEAGQAAEPLLVVSGADLRGNELPFGTVVLGDTAERSLTLSNRGAAPLAITSVALSGPSSARFELGGPCLGAGLVLDIDASCELLATMHADQTGFAETGLVITSTSVEPPPSITLIGRAIAPPTGDAIFANGFDPNETP